MKSRKARDLPSARNLKGVRGLKGARGLKGTQDLKGSYGLKGAHAIKGADDIPSISDHSSGLGLLQDAIKHQLEENIEQLQENVYSFRDKVQQNIQSGLSQALNQNGGKAPQEKEQENEKAHGKGKKKGKFRRFGFRKLVGKKPEPKHKQSLILYLGKKILKHEINKRTKGIRRKWRKTIQPAKEKLQPGLSFPYDKLLAGIQAGKEILDRGMRELAEEMQEAPKNVERTPGAVQETLGKAAESAQEILTRGKPGDKQEQQEAGHDIEEQAPESARTTAEQSPEADQKTARQAPEAVQETLEKAAESARGKLRAGLNTTQNILSKGKLGDKQEQQEAGHDTEEQASEAEQDTQQGHRILSEPAVLSKFDAFRDIPSGLAKAIKQLTPQAGNPEESRPAEETAQPEEIRRTSANDVLDFLKNANIINADLPLKTFAENVQSFQSDPSAEWGIIGDTGHLVLVWKN